MDDRLLGIDDAGQDRPTRSSLMTFGYGTRSEEEALALLARYGIDYVIDVRSPDSIGPRNTGFQ